MTKIPTRLGRANMDDRPSETKRPMAYLLKEKKNNVSTTGALYRNGVQEKFVRFSPAKGAGVRVTSGEGVTTAGVPVRVTVNQPPKMRKKRGSSAKSRREGHAQKQRNPMGEKRSAIASSTAHTKHKTPECHCVRSHIFVAHNALH